MIRICSYLKDRRGALAIGLLFAAMAATPMWGQWNGTNPVWTNSNVGIGTASPPYMLTIAPQGVGSGLAVGWNKSVGQGETNFYNYGQGGSGGFSFWNYPNPGAGY